MIRLKTHLGDYPGTAALRRGELRSTLVDFDFVAIKPVSAGFKRVVRDLEFDLAELAIVTYLQAVDHGTPLVMLPIVVGPGRFQHQCLVHNSERGPLGAADLAGKRLGTRSYSQTTPAWIRAFLQHDYGVAPQAMQWITFEDAHVAAVRDPPFVTRAPSKQDLTGMLLAGEVDAMIIGNDAPTDPRIQPVITDHVAAAKSWARAHHAVPINHVIVIEGELANARPEIVTELTRLFAHSKLLGSASVVPFDMLPQGADAMHTALDLIAGYAFEQGLLRRRISADELLQPRG